MFPFDQLKKNIENSTHFNYPQREISSLKLNDLPCNKKK